MGDDAGIPVTGVNQRVVPMRTGNVPPATYVCQNCQGTADRRSPKCPHCREWGTLVRDTRLLEPETVEDEGEEEEESELKPLSEYEAQAVVRIRSGIAGFDLVTGGGFARGRVLLIYSKPGVGKSTLLLQALSEIAERKEKGGTRLKTGVCSSEEAISATVALIERIGGSKRILALHESDLDTVLEQAEEKEIDVLLMDSVQMFRDAGIRGAPGDVLQIKNFGDKVSKYARRTGMAIVVICQVTKEGGFAGPNFLEHVLDGSFHLFKVKKDARVFWCPRKNRLGRSGLRWKCQMDAQGRIVDRFDAPEEPEYLDDAPVAPRRSRSRREEEYVDGKRRG
jgi:predicted ATP-dependent serine protease